MKIVLTIDVPGNDIAGVLEEIELDVMDAIQCGETNGTIGYRCLPSVSGTWKIEGLPTDWGE